jgi:signal transduction histidine kinase
MQLGTLRRTVRLRFTALYGGVFLLSGAVLLAIAALVSVGSTSTVAVGQFGQQPSPTQADVQRLQDQLAQAHSTQWRQLLFGSAVALGVMAVLSLVVGWMVAGRVLRPLRRMAAATQRISAENLHERLAVSGPADEVKDLADTIDRLLERLEGAFASQRRFVANASHELRTPLATMRASLDVAVGKPEPPPPQTFALAERVRTELDHVDRLLDGLLVLARTQHGDLPGRTHLSLAEIATAAVDARCDDIAARRLTLDTTIVGPAALEGDATLLRRLIDNLVDNAIRHNRDGGRIRVAVASDGTFVRLVVETGGPVLDAAEVARLAEPFRRLGTQRTGPGTGLGLSIVEAIASAHGGTLSLLAPAEGGLRVTVALPTTTSSSHPEDRRFRAKEQA